MHFKKRHPLVYKPPSTLSPKWQSDFCNMFWDTYLQRDNAQLKANEKEKPLSRVKRTKAYLLGLRLYKSSTG